MKAKTDKKEPKEPKEPNEISEEDSLKIRQSIHQSMSSNITFAEVMQLVNNVLIQETEQRFKNMSTEEARNLLDEVNKENKASEEENKV